MYKPAPPRPKKTNITRTRTGCLECRTRRVRCDEKKPMCGRCERLGGDCKHETAFKFYQVYKHEVAEKRTVNHPTIVASLRGHHGGSIREPSQPNITATKAADGSRHARTEFQT
ncbi:hypothetical protein MY5147_004539 [Beauveria neobassiana]